MRDATRAGTRRAPLSQDCVRLSGYLRTLSESNGIETRVVIFCSDRDRRLLDPRTISARSTCPRRVLADCSKYFYHRSITEPTATKLANRFHAKSTGNCDFLTFFIQRRLLTLFDGCVGIC